MGTILSLAVLAVLAAGFLSPPATAAAINVRIVSPTGARPVFVKSGSTVSVTIQYDAVGMYRLQGAVELLNAQNVPVAGAYLYSLLAGAGVTREVGLRLPAQTPDGSYGLRVRIEGYLVWTSRINGSASESGAVVVDNQPPKFGEFVPQPGEVVGNAHPTIAARVDDAVRASLTVNGAVIPSTAFELEGGVLRYLPSSPLPQGKNTVALTAADRAGNTGTSPPWEFTVDTVPPSVTVVAPAPEAVVDNPTARIAARISDASRIAYAFKVAGQDVTARTTVNGEEVSYVPAPPLPSGRVTVEVTATDAAGNRGAQQWGFVVDTGGPKANLATDTRIVNATGPGAIRVVAEARDDNPTVASLAIKKGETSEWIPLVERTGVQGTFEYLLSTSRLTSDGEYIIRLIVRDSLGLTDTAQLEILVDRTAPVLAGFGPEPGKLLGNAQPLISARVGDAAQVELAVNDVMIPAAAYSLVEGVVSYTPADPLPQGTNRVALTARDSAGNAAGRQWDFSVDTASPVLTVVSPAQGTEVDNPKPVISARISDRSAVTFALKVAGTDVTGQVSTDGQVSADGEVVSYLPAEPLPDGKILVELSAADAAGNQAALEWEFAVATWSPVGSLFADTSVINAAGPAFVKLHAGVTASGPVAVELAVKNADAAEWVPLEQHAGVQGAYQYQLDSAALASDGQYTLRLTGRDANGVSGATYATILVDRTPPAFMELPANDATVEFNRATIYFGYAGADSFHLLVDGQPVDQKQVAVLEVPGGKKVIYVPAAPLEAGKKHQALVTLVDAAGNTALKESSFTVLSARRGFGFGRLWFE